MLTVDPVAPCPVEDATLLRVFGCPFKKGNVEEYTGIRYWVYRDIMGFGRPFKGGM